MRLNYKMEIKNKLKTFLKKILSIPNSHFSLISNLE